MASMIRLFDLKVLIYLIIKVKTLHINTNKKDNYMGAAC